MISMQHAWSTCPARPFLKKKKKQYIHTYIHIQAKIRICICNVILHFCQSDYSSVKHIMHARAHSENLFTGCLAEIVFCFFFFIKNSVRSSHASRSTALLIKLIASFVSIVFAEYLALTITSIAR